MSEQIDFELSALVRYGVSDNLVSLLQCIEQATMMDGSLRYQQKAVYEMRRNILCHNYGKSMYELAHILIAITHAGPGFDDLFYFDEAITPERFRQQITKWQSSESLRIDAASTLDLEFCNSRRFEFHYRRINWKLCF